MNLADVPESGVSVLEDSLGVECDSLEDVSVWCEWWMCSGPLDNEVAVEGVDEKTGWMADEWLASLCNKLEDSTM